MYLEPFQLSDYLVLSDAPCVGCVIIITITPGVVLLSRVNEIT